MDGLVLVSLYVIGGLWGLLLIASFVGMPRRYRIDLSSPKDLPPQPAFLSVLIPARDEEANIGRCLESLLAQDYPRYEIIVANDRSTDRTEQIVREMAARFPQLRLINVTHLPAGWTGKNHALHLAAREARGDYLVFTDADTYHSPSCLRLAMSYILRHNVDVFTTVSQMENKTFWEKCLTPLMGLLLMVWYPPAFVNSRRYALGFANGQFIIVARRAYEIIGGHEAVRGELLEDIALGKLAKRKGLKLRLVLAPGLYTTRMYPNFGRFFHGWSRILLQGLDKSPAKLALFFLFGVVMSVYPTVMLIAYAVSLCLDVHHTEAFIFGGWLGVYLIKVWTVSNTYFISGAARRYALLNPISTLVSLAIIAHAFYKAINKNSVIVWRGTQYSAR